MGGIYGKSGGDPVDEITVEAAGAVMEEDTSVDEMDFVIDEDDMKSDSATKIPTQQSVKAYVDSKTGSSGGLVYVETLTASSSASLITSTLSAADMYLFVLKSIKPATDNAQFQIHASQDNGSSYIESGNSYNIRRGDLNATDNTANSGQTSIGFVPIAHQVGNNTGEELNGKVEVFNNGSTARVALKHTGIYTLGDGTLQVQEGFSMFNNSAAVNKIRFKFGSGNIASGTIEVFRLS